MQNKKDSRILPEVTQLSANFQKLQITLLRGGKTFYKKSCSERTVSYRRLGLPKSNPALKKLKNGTPWAWLGCFGHQLSAFEVKKKIDFLQGVETAAICITECTQFQQP